MAGARSAVKPARRLAELPAQSQKESSSSVSIRWRPGEFRPIAEPSPGIAIKQLDSNFYPAAKESATTGRVCARGAQVSQRQVRAGLRILA
jgi:hypothetical protein